MSIPRVRRALLSLALLLGLTAPAAAQVQGGTITGTIRDQQGAVLPGVEVTLTGPAETSTYTTGPDGQFRFLNVAPGTFQRTASLSGFARLVRDPDRAIGRAVVSDDHFAGQSGVLNPGKRLDDALPDRRFLVQAWHHDRDHRRVVFGWFQDPFKRNHYCLPRSPWCQITARDR